jgi:hypothetical protein
MKSRIPAVLPVPGSCARHGLRAVELRHRFAALPFNSSNSLSNFGRRTRKSLTSHNLGCRWPEIFGTCLPAAVSASRVCPKTPPSGCP